jgi:hypothetical protein
MITVPDRRTSVSDGELRFVAVKETIGLKIRVKYDLVAPVGSVDDRCFSRICTADNDLRLINALLRFLGP